MLKIRLQRTGRNQEKTFRLVLTESKNSTKSGKFLEVLGYHDFRVKNGTKINNERVLYWMSKGVKATPPVHNLFLAEKIISGKKINKNHLLDKPQGVRGRNSDNTLCKKVLGWEPKISLEDGLEKTYKWIEKQI